jgi:hypothetical protein
VQHAFGQHHLSFPAVKRGNVWRRNGKTLKQLDREQEDDAADVELAQHGDGLMGPWGEPCRGAAARAVYNQSLSGDTQRHRSCVDSAFVVSQAARVQAALRRDSSSIPFRLCPSLPALMDAFADVERLLRSIAQLQAAQQLQAQRLPAEQANAAQQQRLAQRAEAALRALRLDDARERAAVAALHVQVRASPAVVAHGLKAEASVADESCRLR